MLALIRGDTSPVSKKIFKSASISLSLSIAFLKVCCIFLACTSKALTSFSALKATSLTPRPVTWFGITLPIVRFNILEIMPIFLKGLSSTISSTASAFTLSSTWLDSFLPTTFSSSGSPSPNTWVTTSIFSGTLVSTAASINSSVSFATVSSFKTSDLGFLRESV